MSTRLNELSPLLSPRLERLTARGPMSAAPSGSLVSRLGSASGRLPRPRSGPGTSAADLGCPGAPDGTLLAVRGRACRRADGRPPGGLLVRQTDGVVSRLCGPGRLLSALSRPTARRAQPSWSPFFARPLRLSPLCFSLSPWAVVGEGPSLRSGLSEAHSTPSGSDSRPPAALGGRERSEGPLER
jgi:hypothetical protein